MIDINKVMETYILNGVKRYSNRHRIKEESVAEHSFHVALLAFRICKDMGCDEHTPIVTGKQIGRAHV